MKDLEQIYKQKVAAGEIRFDAEQLQLLQTLIVLGKRISQQKKMKPKRENFFKNLFMRSKRASFTKGLYIYGDVGRGKSMMMDLFFSESEIKEKRRVHFHAFMLEVHDFLHQMREARREGRADGGMEDDLISFASKCAKEARLLCFDEFQVRDVADAMILGRLFKALFQKGVVVVATSNTMPDDLYKDGLQRELFLPFIAMFKERMNLFALSGGKDYRLSKLHDKRIYIVTQGGDGAAELESIFNLLRGEHEEKSENIKAKGREIFVPRASGDIAFFTFDELCVKPKSALDYLELIKRYRVFIVAGVPRLDDFHPDECARFITLIDTLYDNHRYLVVSAAAEPDELYKGDLQADAFARTASRLFEMRSNTYNLF